MPERMSRAEERASLQEADEQHVASLKTAITGPRERVTLAGIEQANVVHFGKKKEAWEKELHELESRSELTQEEGKKKDELIARIDKVEAMEKQAEAVARRDEQERIAKEKAEEIDAMQAELDQWERQQKDAERVVQQKTRTLHEQQERLTELQESFARQPAEDVKTQIDAMPQILKSLEADVERYRGVVQSLSEERIEQTEDLENVMKEHTAALQEAHNADTAASELGVVIAAMSIDLGPGLEPKAEAAPASVPERRASPAPETKPSKPASTASGAGNRLKTAAVYLGGGVAFAGSVAAHAVYYPFRFASRLFENLYHLTMHPGKFFDEIGSKYASEMKEPPEGRGKAFGFMEGTRYLLFGRRIEELEKAKENSKKKKEKKKE